MALPRTISGITFPEQNYFCGPFRDGDGNHYIVILDSADPTLVEIHKADNGDATWSEIDGSNRPDLANVPLSMWAFQDGTTIVIATQITDAVTDVAVEYHRFNTSDAGANPDTWQVTNESVDVVSDADVSGSACSIVVRSDGDRIILHQGTPDNIKGTRYQRIDYSLWEGVSWSTGNAADDAGTAHYHGSSMVLGVSDKAHLFFKDHTNSDILHKSLDSGNSLSSVEIVNDTTVRSTIYIIAPSVYYDAGGTERITVTWVDTTAAEAWTSEIDADGVPGAEEQASDNEILRVNEDRKFCLAVDPATDTVYLIYSDGIDDDVFIDSNVNGGGWNTDIEILDGVAVTEISANIFTIDGGDTVLGYLYDDGGTIKYNEFVIVEAIFTQSVAGSLSFVGVLGAVKVELNPARRLTNYTILRR